MIAILCPSRDRPEKLQRLIDSVAATSTKAKVIAWIDPDQSPLYAGIKGAITDGGSFRVSVVEAMNRLAHHHREFRVYGMMPDDAYMTTPGWDDWMLSQFDTFSNDIGVVSPCHSYGEYVDMPFVARNWIEAIGWFAYPAMYHYAWTLCMGLLGECTNIVYATKEQMHIAHEHVDSPNMSHYENDCSLFFNRFIQDYRGFVAKLRAAM